MKHQRAVVHDAALLQILGIAGEFFPFNADIVSAIDLSRHIERTQQLCNRLTEQTNIQIGCILCIENKCEVQIPQIMIYGTAAGKSTDNGDMLCIGNLLIDLCKGVLIFTDDNGVIVLPKHEVFLTSVHSVENILLQSQIKSRICAGGFDIDHNSTSFVFVFKNNIVNTF